MIVNRYSNANTDFSHIFYYKDYLVFIRILKYILKMFNNNDNIYIKNVYNFLDFKEKSLYINKEAKKLVNNFYTKQGNEKKDFPLFSSIELETINRCNGICPFCPVNIKEDKRKFRLMDEKLFKSIINQLKQLNYSGRLSLHSNNEPFLDNRIIDFAKYIRENLPNVYVLMYTNGTLLTLDKFIKIIPYLDKMVIDNYNDTLKLNNNSKIIYKYCRNNIKLNKKVEIHLRKVNEVLTTRGGQSPNNRKKKTLNILCPLPFQQIVIRPDGKLSLCCSDALGKFTMGDLNKQNLVQIWNSNKYKIIRNKLKNGRKNISLCKYCDCLIYQNLPKQ